MFAEYMREKLSEYLEIRDKGRNMLNQAGGVDIISTRQLGQVSSEKTKKDIISIGKHLDALESIMEAQCNQGAADTDYPILVQTLGNIKTKLDGLRTKFEQKQEQLEEDL